MIIRDAMKKDVPVCENSDPAARAVRLMLESGHAYLPVKEGELFQGMISWKEVLELAYVDLFDTKRDFLHSEVGTLIIESDECSIDPDCSIREGISLMRSRGIAALAVLEDGQLLGLVFLEDLAAEKNK